MKQILYPTHEGMVKLAYVFKKYIYQRATLYEHPECKNTFFVQLINSWIALQIEGNEQFGC